MPEISVVMPVYNRAALIGETLKSVQAQSFTDWELIVVDDHSSDNTLEIVGASAGADARIRVYSRAASIKGASVCRNEGAENAAANLLVFLDSDDLLARGCLGNRVAIMKNAGSELDMAVFQTGLFNIVPGDMGLCFNRLDYQNDLEHFLAGDAIWLTPSPVWRKSFFSRIGAWDRELSCCQDWELHARALMRGARYEKHDVVDTYARMNHGYREAISSKVTSAPYAAAGLLAAEKIFHQLVHQQDAPPEYFEAIRLSVLRFLHKLSAAHRRRAALSAARRLCREKTIGRMDLLNVVCVALLDACNAKLSAARDVVSTRRYPKQQMLLRRSVRFRLKAERPY